MRIIHTSDLHLDSPLTARLSAEKIKERKSELLLSFKRLCTEAKNTDTDAVIISGDLFDSEKVGKRTIRSVLDIIRDSAEVTFFYLFGNHEKEALYSCGEQLPENLRLFGEKWTYHRLGDINIIGRTETCPQMFSELSLNEDEKNLLVLHGELRDKSEHGGIIGKNEIKELPIDYLALGHYHSYSATQLSNRTAAVYCGTPEGRGFDETGPCGFVMIDTDQYGVAHRFVKTALRSLHQIDVDVADSQTDIALIYKIEERLSSVKKSDLVRVRLLGERELGKTYKPETFMSAFRDFYYFELKDCTRVRICVDDFKNDISLKGEFIRGVLLDESLSEEEKDAIINLGLSVLIGEED